MSTVYSIARHASADGQARMARLNADERRALARQGGQARMARLNADERRALARQGGQARMARLDDAGRRALGQAGLHGLARRHFGGDVDGARAWLVAKGLFEQDPGRGTSWSLYPDPGQPSATDR